MYVHPFVDAFLKKGIISEYLKWRFEYGFKFKILPDQSLAHLQYRVIDSDGKEIDLKEEKDSNSSNSKKESRSKAQNDED
jgi:ribonuclease G